MVKKKRYLITGGAGFIGSFVAKKLIELGHNVVIVDNFNKYYESVTGDKKYANLKKKRYNFVVGKKAKLYKINIADYKKLKTVFKENKFDAVCHLAAQAGVRYSNENPFVYEDSNVKGTLNLLELAKEFKIKTFVMASSSSVYGGNKETPFKESHRTDNAVSVYAATKKATEVLGHVYHHTYGLNVTCLRFFTVYGPWGRPDMAPFIFTDRIVRGKTIDVFGKGKFRRDFTYIEDIVEGVIASLEKSYAYEIFNLGNSNPISVNKFIKLIEKELGTIAKKKFKDAPLGDVKETYASIAKAKKMLGYNPKTKIEEGIKHTVRWYVDFYSEK